MPKIIAAFSSKFSYFGSCVQCTDAIRLPGQPKSVHFLLYNCNEAEVFITESHVEVFSEQRAHTHYSTSTKGTWYNEYALCHFSHPLFLSVTRSHTAYNPMRLLYIYIWLSFPLWAVSLFLQVRQSVCQMCMDLAWPACISGAYL